MRRIWILAAVLALLLTACAGEAAVGEPLPLGEDGPRPCRPPLDVLQGHADCDTYCDVSQRPLTKPPLFYIMK